MRDILPQPLLFRNGPSVPRNWCLSAKHPEPIIYRWLIGTIAVSPVIITQKIHRNPNWTTTRFLEDYPFARQSRHPVAYRAPDTKVKRSEPIMIMPDECYLRKLPPHVTYR